MPTMRSLVVCSLACQANADWTTINAPRTSSLSQMRWTTTIGMMVGKKRSKRRSKERSLRKTMTASRMPTQMMMTRMSLMQQNPASHRRVEVLVKTNVSVVALQGTAVASASTKTDPRTNGQCAKGQPKHTMCLVPMSMTTMVKMIWLASQATPTTMTTMEIKIKTMMIWWSRAKQFDTSSEQWLRGVDWF